MISENEKLIGVMSNRPFIACRDAYIQRARIESKRLEGYKKWLEENGFESVLVEPDAVITDDGREVLWVGGAPYALPAGLHKERLAAAFAAEKKRQSESDTKSVIGTESLSVMVCPKCGDTLQHTAVCPKCAAGKLGYRHRYTCVCGVVDLVSKEKL